MFVPRQLSWYDALAYCASTRGYLVALETEAEHTYITEQIASNPGMPFIMYLALNNVIATAIDSSITNHYHKR